MQAFVQDDARCACRSPPSPSAVTRGLCCCAKLKLKLPYCCDSPHRFDYPSRSSFVGVVESRRLQYILHYGWLAKCVRCECETLRVGPSSVPTAVDARAIHDTRYNITGAADTRGVLPKLTAQAEIVTICRLGTSPGAPVYRGQSRDYATPTAAVSINPP